MRPPEMKRPGLAGTGSENIRSKQAPGIIAFPASKSTCQSCRIPFRPRHPRHRLCVDCYAWRRIYLGTMAARAGAAGDRAMMDGKEDMLHRG